MSKHVQIKELIGKTFTLIIISPEKEEIKFFLNEKHFFSMHHSQSCCESVAVEDIIGDLNDLVNTPILVAEEVTSREHLEDKKDLDEGAESFTWTFYKFSTIKGSVTIRWFGTSNGYYSEDVDIWEEIFQ